MSEQITRYRVYSTHLKQKFGQKIYKLPVNLPGNCPNRDGTLGQGGCIFCDEEGAGFQCLPNTLSVQQQLAANKEFFKQRFKAQKFMAYLQSFTNTYLPLAQFQKNITAAVADPDIVGISISTRPDCINNHYLDLLQNLKDAHPQPLAINIELGLQTVNYHTLRKINRGHTLAEFIAAVQRIKQYNFEICTHIILNLPWDNLEDTIENAKILSALGIHYVKLHSLYIVKNTVLADMYQQGEFTIISLDEYINRVVTFLEYLDPGIVIQRLVGKGPPENNLFCNWDTSWWIIKQQIEKKLVTLNTYQGKKFNYLNKQYSLNKQY
ncbi:TIGR01212 family radical SAM protein [Peptococcaceae bacterium]|nr:TIGR01212 family radical SAM protein [Peptococcaceae bacterium]